MIIEKELIPQISLGQVQFDESVPANAQKLLRQAWIDRFKGFDEGNLDFYLQHQNKNTRYQTGSLVLSGKLFKFIAGIIFFFRKILRPFGVIMTSDLLAARISRVEGSELYTTQGTLVVNINKGIFRESHLQVWIKIEGDKVEFVRAKDKKTKPADRKYKLIKEGNAIHYILNPNNQVMSKNLLIAGIVFSLSYALMKITFTFLLWFEPVWFMEHIFPPPYPAEDFGSLLPARWIANRNLPLGLVIVALVIKKEYRLLGIILIMGGVLELMDGGVMMLSLMKGITMKLTTVSMIVGYLLFILGIYFGIKFLNFKKE